MNNIEKYIKENTLKFHLEYQLKNINKKLEILKEGEEAENETKVYERNVYESYKKDLEEVVNSLADACNKLESAALKQESHIKTLPEVNSRTEEGRSHKQVILDIFREVKKAKITAERKLYEMR